MHRHITLLCLTLLMATSASAWKGEQFDAANTYYMMNVANGQFLTDSPAFSAEPYTVWTPEWAKTDDDGVETYNLNVGEKYIYIYDSWRGWNYSIYVNMRSSSYRWRLEQQGDDYVYALRSNHQLATGNTFSQNKKYLYMASDGSGVGYKESAGDASAQWLFISPAQVELMATVAEARALMAEYESSAAAKATLQLMIESVTGEEAELPTTAAAYAEAKPLLDYAIAAYKQNVALTPGMEVTNLFIKNPSFETGPYLVNEVSGWEVTRFEGNGGEAFSSEKIADRIFEGVEGNYLYNTWGGTPADDYQLRQDLGVLPAGRYELTFVVASDDTVHRLNCTFGTTPRSIAFGNDKTVGVSVSIQTESDGETPVRIALRGECWFKADAFHLKYADYPTSVREVNSGTPRDGRLFDLSGRRVKSAKTGIVVNDGRKIWIR